MQRSSRASVSSCKRRVPFWLRVRCLKLSLYSAAGRLCSTYPICILPANLNNECLQDISVQWDTFRETVAGEKINFWNVQVIYSFLALHEMETYGNEDIYFLKTSLPVGMTTKW